MIEITCKSFKNIILEYIENTTEPSEYYRTFPIIYLENEFIIYSQFNGNIIFHENSYYCILILEIQFVWQHKILQR